MRPNQLRTAGGRHAARISGVELGECGHRRSRLPPPRELLAKGRQLIQGSAGRPDCRLVQLGQRDGQDVREAARLDVLPHLRLA